MAMPVQQELEPAERPTAGAGTLTAGLTTTTKWRFVIMANQQPTIPIPLSLPRDEATALAQFVKRVGYEDVNHFASPCVTYGDACRSETDVMWCSVNMLRAALA